MVSTVPRPLTSMRAPSSTTRLGPPVDLDPRHPALQAEPAGEPAGDAVVVVVVVVLGPGVEPPVDQGEPVGGGIRPGR